MANPIIGGEPYEPDPHGAITLGLDLAADTEDHDSLTELIGTEGGEDARATVVADGYRAEAWPSVVYTFKGSEGNA